MLRSRLTYANVMSTIAVFLALGGGVAYAANTIFSEDIVDGEVKSADLGAGAVTGGKLGANTVSTNKILDGGVALADLAGDSVDGSKVLDSSLSALDLSFNSVGSDEIQTDAVQATEIADGAIDSGEIEDDSLFENDLGANSVGSSELKDSAVGTTDVANNSLTTADLLGTDAGGAISLGAGAVANGRCNDYDITVPGAAVGQAVMISTKAATQAGTLIYGQRVSAAGHVIMKACNFSGTTWAGFSNLPIRTITFG